MASSRTTASPSSERSNKPAPVIVSCHACTKWKRQIHLLHALCLLSYCVAFLLCLTGVCAHVPCRVEIEVLEGYDMQLFGVDANVDSKRSTGMVGLANQGQLPQEKHVGNFFFSFFRGWGKRRTTAVLQRLSLSHSECVHTHVSCVCVCVRVCVCACVRVCVCVVCTSVPSPATATRGHVLHELAAAGPLPHNCTAPCRLPDANGERFHREGRGTRITGAQRARDGR